MHDSLPALIPPPQSGMCRCSVQGKVFKSFGQEQRIQLVEFSPFIEGQGVDLKCSVRDLVGIFAGRVPASL